MVDAIGCIALAGSVLQLCYQYGSKVADSAVEAKRFTDELISLSGLLVAVQGITNNAGVVPGRIDTDEVILQCIETLENLHARLQTHAPHAESRRLHRSIKRLTWPFKRDETLIMIGLIERQKSAVNLVLNGFTMQFLRDQGLKIDHLLSSVDDIRDILLQERESTHQQHILNWLTDFTQEADHERNCQLRYDNTCVWLLKNDSFYNWQTSSRSCLWYQGDSGTGKTILASYVIEHERNRLQERRDCVLAYLYFDAGMQHILTIRNVAGSILRQICQQTGISPEIEDEFKSSQSRRTPHERPSEAVLRLLLKGKMQSIQKLVLVVDAVDEAQSPVDLCRLLTSITKWAMESCHIFVTSRPNLTFIAAIPDSSTLTASRMSLKTGIVEYINQRITHDARLQRIGSNLKHEISYKIVRKADGMIRWAQCLLDDISRLRTDRAIRYALESLPKSLEESYRRELAAIDQHDLDLAHCVLRWLCYTFSPLKINELAEAVVLEPGMIRIDNSIRLHDSHDVVNVLPTMVTYSELTKEVRLAHLSVSEYLTSDPNIPFACMAQTSHKIIAEICLTYILADDFDHGPLSAEELEDTFEKFPLLSYAARWWPDHVKSSANEEALLPLILRLLTPQPTPRYLFWLQVILYFSYHGYRIPTTNPDSSSNPDPDANTNNNKVPPTPTPIYHASSYGLLHTVKSLIQSPETNNINTRAGQYGGTALHAACWRNHKEIIKVLLDAGADINIIDYNGHTPYDSSGFSLRMREKNDRPGGGEKGDRFDNEVNEEGKKEEAELMERMKPLSSFWSKLEKGLIID